MSSVSERRRRNVRSVYARPGPKDSASLPENQRPVWENRAEGDQDSTVKTASPDEGLLLACFSSPEGQALKEERSAGQDQVQDEEGDDLGHVGGRQPGTGRSRASTESSTPRKVGRPRKEKRPSSEGTPRKVGRPRKLDKPGPDSTPRTEGRPSEEGVPRKVGRPRKECKASEEGVPQKVGRPRKESKLSEEGVPKKVGRPRKESKASEEGVPQKVGRPRKAPKECQQESSDPDHLPQEAAGDSRKSGAQGAKVDCGEELSISEVKPYACALCQRRYTSIRSLKQHEWTHHEQPSADGAQASKLQCQICHKVFQTRYSLANHQAIHAEVRPFACDICDKSYTHKNFLDFHMTIHTGERPFECDVCKKTYRRKFDLQQHKRLHTGEKPYVCNICGKAFVKRLYLTTHMQVHNGLKPFKCDQCPMTFRRTNVLKRHKQIEHEGVKPFKCKVCKESFSSKPQLIVHSRSHPKKPSKASLGCICEVCGKHLVAHTLKGHMMTHTGERPYVCEVCNRGFIRKYDWVVHMRSHTGEKPFICSMCAAGFVTNVDLRRHVNSVHRQLRPFQCDICNKHFMYAQTLKKHKELHAGSKTFRCDRCDKKYTTKGSLTLHKRTHTGEKPFACPHCPMRFIEASSKNRHVLLHTGEKPYKCNQCPAEFSRVEPYRQHREKVHRIINEKRFVTRYERLPETRGENRGDSPGEEHAVATTWPVEATSHFVVGKSAQDVCSRASLSSAQASHFVETSDVSSLGQTGEVIGMAAPCTMMVVQPLETYYDTLACPAFDIPSAPTVVVESSHYHAPCSQPAGQAAGTSYVHGLGAGVMVEPVASAYSDPHRSVGSEGVEFSEAKRKEEEEQAAPPRQDLYHNGGHVPVDNCASSHQSAAGKGVDHKAEARNVSPVDLEIDCGEDREEDTLEDDGIEKDSLEEDGKERDSVQDHRKEKNREDQDPVIKVESTEREKTSTVGNWKADVVVAPPFCSDPLKADSALYVAGPDVGSSGLSCGDHGHTTAGAAVTPLVCGEGQDSVTLTVVESQGHTSTITVLPSTSDPSPCLLIYQDNGGGNFTLLDSSGVLSSAASTSTQTETVVSLRTAREGGAGGEEVAASGDQQRSEEGSALDGDGPVVVKTDQQAGPPPSEDKRPSRKRKPTEVKIDMSLVEDTLKTRKRVFGQAQKNHICEICGNGFTQKSSLRSHLAVQHKSESNGKSYFCDICNKPCPSKSMLETHRRSHSGDRPFPCKICGKTYKHKPDLRHHINKHHFGDRPFSCETCHKSFTERSSLRQHRLIHQGVKPHVCLVCSKRFTQQGTLHTHQRIHSGEKPFICQYCGKNFTDKATMRRHQRMHTGEKPYKCERCSCAFARSEQLKKHTSQDHPGHVQDRVIVADAVASIQ